MCATHAFTDMPRRPHYPQIKASRLNNTHLEVVQPLRLAVVGQRPRSRDDTETQGRSTRLCRALAHLHIEQVVKQGRLAMKLDRHRFSAFHLDPSSIQGRPDKYRTDTLVKSPQEYSAMQTLPPVLTLLNVWALSKRRFPTY